MPVSLLAGLAAGAGVGLAQGTLGAAVQYHNQKQLNAQAQRNYERNLALQQRLHLDTEFKQVAQSTAALRAAGLSPALAAGANFSAPSASAPLASSSAGMSDFNTAAAVEAVKGMAALDSQTKLNEAAAAKAQAEADRTNLEVKHLKSEDKVLTESAYQMIDEMRENTDNPFMRGFLDNFLSQNSDEIDLGAYKAFNQVWFEFTQRERDRELDFIAKEMDKKVLLRQYENGTAEALADMDKARRMHLYRNITLMNANIDRLNAETSLTEDRRNQIRAEIEKLGQDTASILHHDPAAMWKAGDISSLLAVVGFETIKAVGAGAGFAAASRFAGKAGKASVASSDVDASVAQSRKQINMMGHAAEQARRNAEAGRHYRENQRSRHNARIPDYYQTR